ncbi:MAG: hypothetical protein INR62_13835 [Rhodospirillales bacterium]|nr:hypothetical protein [Acetobacter sp.]
MFNKLIVPMLLAASACAFGQNLPKGSTIPDNTLSPDRSFGVTVPDIFNSPDNARNCLVDAHTGHVLAIIQAGSVGYNRMNHGEVLPSRWSSDGSVLVWQVDGKWSDEALVVVKLQDGKVAWQANVLKLGEQAILDRTKQATPKKYARVRKTNVGMGTMGPHEVGGVDDPRSAYPEGFSIQVDVVGPVTFPLRITAELTSEAKPGVPLFKYLQSHLNGVLDAGGKFTVTSFGLGPARSSHFD